MPAESYGVIIILLVAIFLWVTEKLHPAVTGLLIIVLLALFRVVSFEQAVSGFVDGSIWLLVGIFILSAAMDETGLDRRIAYSIIVRARDNGNKLIFASCFVVMLLAFLVPSAAARTALLIPIITGVIKTMSLEKSNYAKALLLSTTYTTHSISTSLMTSSLATVYTVSLLEKNLGYSMSYLEWVVLMAPPAFVTTIIVILTVMKVFPIEKVSLAEGVRSVEEKLKSLGGASAAEKKLIVLFCLMLLLLFTNSLLDIPVGLIVLSVSVLAFIPGIRLIAWPVAMRKMDWGSIIIFGASLGLAAALEETGTIAWMSEATFGFTSKIPVSLITLSVCVFFMFIKLGFGSVIGFVTVMLPAAIATANINGINPVWLTMVALLGSQLAFLLPTQSPANLPAYATGFFKMKDMVKAGLAVSFVFIIMSVLTANFYWPVLGLTP